MLITILASLMACGGAEPPPTSTPEGRLCGRAYGSTIDSLDELYTKAGKDMPTPTPKADYVKLCVEMGFSEEQLKCLDPKIAGLDESCAKLLEPVKDKTKKLAQSLLPKSTPPDKKEEGSAEEKKEEGTE